MSICTRHTLAPPIVLLEPDRDWLIARLRFEAAKLGDLDNALCAHRILDCCDASVPPSDYVKRALAGTNPSESTGESNV
jgi:hypothetical protein